MWWNENNPLSRFFFQKTRKLAIVIGSLNILDNMFLDQQKTAKGIIFVSSHMLSRMLELITPASWRVSIPIFLFSASFKTTVHKIVGYRSKNFLSPLKNKNVPSRFSQHTDHSWWDFLTQDATFLRAESRWDVLTHRAEIRRSCFNPY